MPTVGQITVWLTENQLLVFSLMVPVSSALVAALSAWYSTRRALRTDQSKLGLQGTLKISDFRQVWINELRDCMAAYQSRGIFPNSDPTQDQEFYRLGTKIELLMNPGDEDYEALSYLMYNFVEAAQGDTSRKYEINPHFVQLCQRILKREWERLKGDLHTKMIIK